MKFKNLFISLGLVLSVGAGIGTALSAKENVKEAEAAVGNVYLLDTSYSTPTVWAWKSDKSSTNVNKSWPGDGMTANGGGAGVWSYSLNDDTVGFLFSDNGSNQTDDLTYNSTYNYFYHRAGFWSNSASVTNGYYFVGGTTDWKIQSSYKMNVSNGKASYTADFSVGDEFKIVNVTLGPGTNWYGYNSVTGTGSSFFVDNEGTSGNNLHCKLAGNYTISFNVSTHAFEITDNTSISTYSYVLTTNSDYNCAYIYNSNI